MVDFDRKIIFTHPQKCGGTTIEGSFKWHPNYVSLKENPEYIDFFKRFKHAGLTAHINYIEELGYSEKQFFKFSCIRNPWDLIISWYFFDKYHNRQEAKASFEDYVERVFKHRNPLDMKRFFCHKDSYNIGYVIRYENYRKDAETIFRKYDVTWSDFNFNSISRPKDTPYQSIHTEKTKDIVYKNARFIINQFEYEF
jgi:hypothetical protein